MRELTSVKILERVAVTYSNTAILSSKRVHTDYQDYVYIYDQTHKRNSIAKALRISDTSTSGTTYTSGTPSFTASLFVVNSNNNPQTIDVTVTINSVLIGTQTLIPGASFLFTGNNYGSDALGQKAYTASWVAI
jgi:hypothetical protein